MRRLLHIEENPGLRADLAQMLERRGFEVTSCRPDDVLEPANLIGFDLVLAGLSGAGQIHLLRTAGQVPVVITTTSGDVRQGVQAMKAGAADYLQLPLEAGELTAALEEAIAHSKRAGAMTEGLPALVAASDVMADIWKQVSQVAPTQAAVLLEGESGTGKSFFAHAIHSASNHRQAPFITVDCAAIPRPAIESELFGMRTVSAGPGGLLQAARGGALFLDEVGALPLEVQGRLEQQLAELADSAQPTRLIASSCRDLTKLAASGLFLEALRRRLSNVLLRLPPLRDRQEDATRLAKGLLSQFRQNLGKSHATLAPDALSAIRSYNWPGNVRELANAMERAAILCQGGEVPASLLAIDVEPDSAHLPSAVEEPGQGSLEAYFVAFVQKHQDHFTETEIAEKLGISRKSLWERRQRLNIPRIGTRTRRPRRA